VRRKQSRPVPLSSLPFNEANAEESILVGLRDSNPNASESLARRELAVLIKSAVALLPEHHQAVVLLRFYGDASLSEIAAALGVPEGTVKSRLHHALETLRNTPALVNLLSNLGDI
jgi:RNA polymerase sigma factor (sigma-70 family)